MIGRRKGPNPGKIIHVLNESFKINLFSKSLTVKMTRQISPLILQLLVLVLALVASPVHACGYIYNDVFWGLPRDTSASIASVLSIPGMSPNSHEMSQRQTIYTPNTNDPLDSLVQLYYRHMCDEGRFLVGMGFGFGLTKVAVGSTSIVAECLRRALSFCGLHQIGYLFGICLIATVRAMKTVVAAYIA